MTIKEFYKTHNNEISDRIHQALKEDSADNDITSKLITKNLFPGRKITARLLCREHCTLAGVSIFKKVLFEVDKKISFGEFYKDGNTAAPNTVILKVSGNPYNILRAERTALNFIQRMSGVATLTTSFVKRLKHKHAKILHTRKSTPNFRLFEFAAVKIAGGDFHRFDLASGILIKDNHIKAAGSVEIALKLLGKQQKAAIKRKQTEIEVKSMSELKQVIEFGKGIIKNVMLDNFGRANLPEAIRKLKKQGFKIELSGGINLNNFRKLQHPGIDFYSIGMLTHSYRSVNFSLDF